MNIYPKSVKEAIRFLGIVLLVIINNHVKEELGINRRSTTPLEFEQKEFLNQHFGSQPPETVSFVDHLIQSGDIERLSKINPAYRRLDRRYDRDIYLNLLRERRSASGSSCVQEKPAHKDKGAVVCF